MASRSAVWLWAEGPRLAIPLHEPVFHVINRLTIGPYCKICLAEIGIAPFTSKYNQLCVHSAAGSGGNPERSILQPGPMLYGCLTCLCGREYLWRVCRTQHRKRQENCHRRPAGPADVTWPTGRNTWRTDWTIHCSTIGFLINSACVALLNFQNKWNKQGWTFMFEFHPLTFTLTYLLSNPSIFFYIYAVFIKHCPSSEYFCMKLCIKI